MSRLFADPDWDGPIEPDPDYDPDRPVKPKPPIDPPVDPPVDPVEPTDPVVPPVSGDLTTELVAIQDINQSSANGDHANDDIATASL